MNAAALGWLWAASAWSGSLDGLPSVVGPGEGQPLMKAVPAGDLDGDGLGDLVVSSPFDDTVAHEAGGVYVLYEVADVAEMTPVAEAGVFLGGEEPVDHAGYEVVSIGDSDLDGYPEVAVGAPDASSDSAAVSGKVYILYSTSERIEGGSLGDHPVMTAAEKYSRLGARIYAVGNADSDPYGRADLLLGVPFPAPSGDVGAGWAGLVYASPLEWGPGNPKPLRMAFEMVGESPHWVVEGAQVGFMLEGAGTMFGRAATRVGDLDGDGVDDLLIGSPHHNVPELGDTALPPGDPDDLLTGPGAVWSFSVKTLAEQMQLPVQLAGKDSIAELDGDYNGDHVPWILDTLTDGRVAVSVAERDLGVGGVYIVSDILGAESLADADCGYIGSDTAELTGWSMAVPGDLRPDSLLAIGMPGWGTNVTGRVVFVEEASGEVPIDEAATVVLEGCWHGGQAGAAVVIHAGPDPEGDDEPWLAITSPGANVYALGDGLATILTASDLEKAAGTECSGIYGAHVSMDGDMDGVLPPDDCDDADPAVYPRAPEVCGNRIDEDCDGVDLACADGAAPVECGCDTTGWPGGVVLVLAVVAAARRRRALVAALAVAGSARADTVEWDADGDPIATLWGSTAFEYLHGPVISGDYDGDGDDDLVIGNFQGITTEFAVGKAYVLGHPLVRGNVWLTDADVTILGSVEHDYLGAAVLTLTPEEGVADHLAVTATHLGLTENEQGEAFVFRAPLINLPAVAPAADPALGLADATLKGDEPGDGFGEQLATGDVDGDGVLDMAISAPFRDSSEKDELGFPLVPEEGRVWLLHNNRIQDDFTAPVFVDAFASGSVAGVDPGKGVGWRMGMGDVDGDGYDELIVGTLGQDNEWFAGEIHVFHDLPATPVPVAITASDGRWITEEREAVAGEGFDVGDFDGDGDDEVAVGSSVIDRGRGRVWLLDGAPDGVEDLDEAAVGVFSGESDGDGVGRSLAIGPALLAGAPYSNQALVLDEDLALVGAFVGCCELGAHVAWVGDFDEDDHPDAVLVAPASSDRREMQGVAYLLSGERVVDGSYPPAAGEVPLDDRDLDGAAVGVDCDDRDPARAPGFVEVCGDGIDNDCDGKVDDETCADVGCATVAVGSGSWVLAVLGAAARRRPGGAR